VSDNVRIFLVDDHPIVRQGVKGLLDAEPGLEVVGEADSAQQALDRVPALQPDMALLDVRLPDASGVDLCRELRAAMPALRVLFLTSYEDDEALFSAIMAGASGYVLKQVRGTDLLDAVRQVASGQSMLDPVMTSRVLTRIREGKPDASQLDQLSERERTVLDLIGRGMTNREIAAELFLAEKTVKNNVTRLLSKLGLERRTQAAVLAAKHAWDRDARQ
jgi:DNA-binding NarL/FixJ family response regulator